MVNLNYRKDHVIKNKYSRSGDPLIRVQAIVVHYTANKYANAEDHQEYFDGVDGGGGRYAGAHIFVDKNEAVEIIPLNEVAYHANEREPLLSSLKASTSYYPSGNANLLTIGIEMCIEEDGSFHSDTVERTRLVIKRLQEKYSQLQDTKNRIVRHYDITHKNCPKPFVENPEAWKKFLDSIDDVKIVSEPIPKPSQLPKVTSFSQYPRYIKITHDTGMYGYANLSHSKGTAHKGTVLKVYGETYAAWVAGGSVFIQKRHSTELSQTIITGGLVPVNVDKVEEYFKTKSIEGSLEFVGKGNPYAKATLKGDEFQSFCEWLDKNKWWYKVER
jgi:N-acetylmuramoyl-L-alanine amidase CwlA